MRLGSALALSLMMALLSALPANAQLVGTPGNGPLTPDGPRRGLGPPSITDNVPDLRLHSDGGGIPGAGPPIDYGRRDIGPYGRSQSLGYFGAETNQARRLGRRCQSERRVCVLASPAPVGTGCSCRLPTSGRARGQVVR
jgi:hypothetical protein